MARAIRSQGSDPERNTRTARRDARRTRRTSILPTNPLSPVPETLEENDQEFIYTITNARGETRVISERTDGQTGRSGRGTVRPGDILTDAQKVGTDAPPSYEQVITETRRNN